MSEIMVRICNQCSKRSEGDYPLGWFDIKLSRYIDSTNNRMAQRDGMPATPSFGSYNFCSLECVAEFFRIRLEKERPQ